MKILKSFSHKLFEYFSHQRNIFEANNEMKLASVRLKQSIVTVRITLSDGLVIGRTNKRLLISYLNIFLRFPLLDCKQVKGNEGFRLT